MQKPVSIRLSVLGGGSVQAVMMPHRVSPPALPIGPLERHLEKSGVIPGRGAGAAGRNNLAERTELIQRIQMEIKGGVYDTDGTKLAQATANLLEDLLSHPVAPGRNTNVQKCIRSVCGGQHIHNGVCMTCGTTQRHSSC